jgi:hypothetical protein
MPKFPDSILTALWERAVQEEIGIAIPTTDPVLLRHKLLAVRPAAEEYEGLITFCPEGRKEVFIVRKSAELPDA